MTGLSMPLISVLIPSYNHESYIAAAIESVLAQTYSDWELIVVDDASTDQTWSVIQSFDDQRIRSFRHTQNQGAVFCLDEAFSYSTGDYIAILNSDDSFHPCRLEKVLAFIHANNCSAVFTDVRFVDESSSDLLPNHPRKTDYQRLSDYYSLKHQSSWFLRGNLAITTSNLFYRRDSVRSSWSTFDLRYTHDWAWCLEQSAYGRLGWLREPLINYRVHPHNTIHESDVWRHRHENAWILGYAIELLPIISAHYQQDMQVDQSKLLNTIFQALVLNRYSSPLIALLLIARSRALNSTSLTPLSSLFNASESTWWAQNLMKSAGYYDTDPMESLDELVSRQRRERALWQVTSDLTCQVEDIKADPSSRLTRVYEMMQWAQVHQDIREMSSVIANYRIEITQIEAELQAIQSAKTYRLYTFTRRFCDLVVRSLTRLSRLKFGGNS